MAIKTAIFFWIVQHAGISIAQELPATARRNTVKVDLLSNVLFRNAMVLSYERVTKPHQTMAITAGYEEFPRLLNLGTGIRTAKEGDKSGLKFGAEYRFYLKKENKHAAPHGVYLGPYVSYLKFNNAKTLQITNSNGEVKQAAYSSAINLFNVGIQAGYQFVIRDRWTIDLVFIGPAVSRYAARFRLNGDFSVDEKHEYQNRIVQQLVDRFPLLDDLLKNAEVNSRGRLDTWSFGYRYQVLVGYRFGKRK